MLQENRENQKKMTREMGLFYHNQPNPLPRTVSASYQGRASETHSGKTRLPEDNEDRRAGEEQDPQ